MGQAGFDNFDIDSFTNFPDKKQKRNSQKSALPVTPAINEQGWLVHLPSFLFLFGTTASIPPKQKGVILPAAGQAIPVNSDLTVEGT